MTVKIKLFSHLKYKLNAEYIFIDLSDQATVADLKSKVREIGSSRIEGIPYRVAIDSKFVEDSVKIHPEDIVALIPPVQGG
jgi:molybdopterin converting factor small subunit